MTTMRWNPLRLAPSITALSAVIAGCGGGGNVIEPPAIVFSSLSVSPNAAAMCLVDPGNTVILNATPRDQNGQVMAGLGSPSFTSSDARAATVAANGQVRAIAAGTAQVTVSLTAAATTRTAVASITVASAIVGDAAGSVLENHPLPHIGVITAAQLGGGNALSLNIQGASVPFPHAQPDGYASTADRCRMPNIEVSSMDTHSDGSGLHSHTVTFN